MDFDSPRASPTVLQPIQKLPPYTNPDFDLGMSEFMTQSQSSSNGQLGTKRYSSGTEVDSGKDTAPPTTKKRLCLSLRKPNRERFSSVTSEEIEEAAKGVVPANTKSSNEWALRLDECK